MAPSPPPTRHSKRKPLEYIEKGFKRLKNPPLPTSLEDESSHAPPHDAPSRTGSPSPCLTSASLATAQSGLPHDLIATGPSPSTPLPVLGTLTTSTKTSTADKLEGVAKSGLESLFRALRISANPMPLLGSAIGELIPCLDTIQATTGSAKEYDELTSSLSIMAGTLQECLGELDLEDASRRAVYDHIALSIKEEVSHIKAKQSRNKGRRLIESAEDADDVILRYRKIEELFRQLQSNINLQTLKNTNRQRHTTLLQGMSPVHDALYDSGYSTTIERRGCTPGTREQIQEGLQNWVRDPNGAKIYWMNGMAGTGKTTIAYTLCEWLQQNRRLGANFFCSRVSSLCRNVNMVIPTLAYRLALYSPAFQSALCRVLEEDPSDSRRNVVKQFQKLIQGPMDICKGDIPEGVVIVIDALDECDDNSGIRLFLETLLTLGSDVPTKFFVTSRPELGIRDNMQRSGVYSPSIMHLHDIEQSIVENDIKKYLEESFATMSPPPSGKQIEQLAMISGRLFISLCSL